MAAGSSMKTKSITLDWKVFIGLITALVGTGGYATLCPTPSGAATAKGEPIAPIEHRLEIRDTVQAYKDRYIMDSIGRVGDKVDKLDRKLDTMMTRQERLLSEMLETVKSGNSARMAARCPAKAAEYTMWDH